MTAGEHQASVLDPGSGEKLAAMHQDAREVQGLAKANNQLIFQQDEKINQLNAKHDQMFDNLKASNRDLHERSVSHQASKKWQAVVLVAVLVAIGLGTVVYFLLV